MLRENLELVEVVYENDKKKAVLRFLDMEAGEILEVNFNKQDYKDGNFVDSEEKSAKVDKWCKEYFDTDFDNLSSRVGDKFDVWTYEKFNSMWEAEIIEKFDKEDQGKIFETTIESITDDGQKISIKYKYKDELHETKMQYSDYVESIKKWFVNPQKQRKQYKKFEEKFGLPVEKAEEIVGKKIMVEIKVAFKKYAYGDIKTPEWA